ncbi:SRPBCC family protein [Mycobacterium sp. pUA109]|uniref:SRPBCC family protein n=1 Tax=Mycobacterium sp. pUA109 TaxID=3238982 RepID=UPI00351B15CB
MSLTVEQSRAIPVGVADAFAGTLPLPLPTLFRRWYGPIPPIKEVRDQSGDWNAAGQTRTVLLTGGGSMREQLTAVDPPHRFDYTLTDIKGPLAPLVDLVEGQWRFTPDGDATQVSWRWTIHPRSVLARPALPVLGRLWKGYARQALAELSAQLAG